MSFKNLLILIFIFILAGAGIIVCQEKTGVLNPYKNVDWEKFEHIHSFSHQHGSSTMGVLEEFKEMGYGHLPLSNYYPSAPTPLPDKFRKKYPDILWAPNAEQHSGIGVGHFNVIDSYYATGCGKIARISTAAKKVSPIEYEYTDLNVYDPEKPWLSVYWFDFIISGKSEAVLYLTVENAQKISPKTYKPTEDNIIKKLAIPAKRSSVYFRPDSNIVKIRLDFNPEEIEKLSIIVRQGVHRPWKEAFKAALDGTLKDKNGNPIEGLRFPDGGGITLNHTAGPFDRILEQLNFDQRVLGIEIWNQHEGFGGRGKTLGFYNLWDNLLKTGTRCFGFFVKDHFRNERGRNILLLPPSQYLSLEEREHNASKAYRNGVFYGMLGAIKINEKKERVMPYDYTQFRFKHILLKEDTKGLPESIDVLVDGADISKRPNVQIRFITDKGVSLIENKPQATYKLTRDDKTGKIVEKYVRIEAFAYPETHLQGTPLKSSDITKMDVLEISNIHDYLGGYEKNIWADKPIPTVDMLFSQPIIFYDK